MNAKRQLVLGVFFVVALSILAFYTLFLTDFSLFKEPIKMTADFHNANALRAGDPVLVAGKRIGRVKAIVYRPEAERDRRIRVEMHLDDAVELNEGYEIAIEALEAWIYDPKELSKGDPPYRFRAAYGFTADT